jgi:hypothetical protein
MPTYTFKCPQCGLVRDRFYSIRTYTDPAFTPPTCHAPMERFFTSPDPTRALDFLISDAIYDGLKAPDGTDISTRAKHRAYMRENNLTTIDDYTETRKRAARERERTLAGEDPHRVDDIVDAWSRHVR